MKIRRMKKEDIREAAQIEREIFSVPWSEQSFYDAIEMEQTIFLTAEEEGRVAGYLGMYLAADEGEITNVAVHKDCRRRHIGRALLMQALTEAAERGADTIFLEVRCSNAPAIALYEQMGFKICGTRRGFYEKPREDACVMVRPDISTFL